MQHSLTITGTDAEILQVLLTLTGEQVPEGVAKAAKGSGKGATKQYSERDLANMDFAGLKTVASSLGIDLSGKKSAGLRKAILATYEETAEDEEDDFDEDEDEDEEGFEDEDEDEWDEDEDEEEEEPEPEPAPVKRGPGRPRKTAAATPAPVKRGPGRPRTRAR